jgi:hypothetical protein
MIRMKPMALFAVVVGMMAIYANSAQGATLSWLILNGAGTTATELKAFLVGEPGVTSPDVTLDGEVSNLKIAVTCVGFSLSGLYLEANGKLTEGGKAVFTSCEVFKEAPLTNKYNCTVKTAGQAAGTIVTNELKGELILIEGVTQLLARIEPKAGPSSTFATLRFEGGACSLPELNQLHGTIFIEDATGSATTFSEKHLLEAYGPQTKLYIGSDNATQLEKTKLLGFVWVKLGNDGAGNSHTGLKWSGMDV